ncbi:MULTISPECIES: metallophosphoesterase family protein [Pandoraea]|uniref:3',5'-cyclic adenosine monophosphate phosphodiesterase CpdA n=2 Tax=Pandoraea TaxID=93217 RepID=A0A5E4XBQ4_9BURK|nr:MULTISPECIES: metallophosphoesterase [Pandoraea]VVE16053.1 3',5'-cyclic adenosine monophosphate phosphodiesterase CpdA [Pandoraea cepalis]VVE33784.1 3',5'-cyclic adenosine monophosphate phosphodiesterase CpdA [Pandoraea terrigena]
MNQEQTRRIKVAHLSDLHFSIGNLLEAGQCFGSAVSTAISERVDVAIISGDLTDHKQDAHSAALHQLMQELRRLADHCPVLILQGTFLHDYPGMLAIYRFAGGKYPVETVDKIGQVALVGTQWRYVSPGDSLDDARLLVSCVPTVNKSDLVSSVGAEHVAQAMGDVLAGLMQGVFAPQNIAASAAGVATVTVGHGTVSGALTEHGVPMAGKDHEFSLGGLYAAQSTATMLGHIHRHQSWDREVGGFVQRVAYPGSIGRFHYGEEGKKGFLIWNIGPRDCDFEFRETPARVMVDFLFDGVPDMAWLEEQAASCVGSFVRVRYSVDAELAVTVDKQAIEQVLAQAAEVRIEPKLLASQRQRCSGISTLSTLAEKVEKWCKSTDNDASVVVPRVRLLGTSDARSIATSLIKELFHEAESRTHEHRDDAGHAVDPFARAERGLDHSAGRELAQ